MDPRLDRAAWLAQVVEPALEPELAICDPHHHLWDRPDERYLVADLIADFAGHRVTSTVFVECMSGYLETGPEALRAVGETRWVDALAAAYDDSACRPCAGIVGMADCLLGERVGEVLDAHLDASERFRGIRHAAGWDASEEVRNSHTNPPRDLYRLPAFRTAFAELEPRGLSFEAWQFHHQLPLVVELAQAFPDTLIVLDHFSGPLGVGPWAGRHAEYFGQWCRDLAAVAACENVVAKLGGLVMPVNGFGFHQRPRPATSDEIVRTCGAYYRHAIECFGADRCMFESNFPVDRASVSYGVLFNAFKKLVADASETEKASLFHDTATRVYRI